MPTAHDVAELQQALARPLPEVPSRWFYDDHGSDLFVQIIDQPEYYPSRVELGILQADAARMLAAAGNPSHLAELGSGAGAKIRTLLDAMVASGRGRSVTMLDINGLYANQSVATLAESYPSLDCAAIVGNFLVDLDRLGPGGDRLILFLAGTLGNLHPDDVPAFMTAVAAQMAPGDHFLVGVDQVKAAHVIEAAYNDAAGVTAAFNLNILRSVNNAFGSDFKLQDWEHRAFYDVDNNWIEMRLRATRDTSAHVVGQALSFSAGDELRTELSCKYTRALLAERAAPAGLVVQDWFTDDEGLFALALLGQP
jgi:L-histidine N-alpha-methyltransferase